LLIKFNSGELLVVPSSQGGAVTLGNKTYTTADITQHSAPQAVYTSLGNNQKSYVLPELYTGPASLHLKYQLIDNSANAVIIGSTDNDFIKLGGTGNKAVSGGGGNNVIDGGTGSTFISGGGTTDNSNTFFLDGRAPGTSWSTITDFHLNHDYVTIWGWLAGVSKVDTLFTDVDTGGATSYTGLTLHFNNLLPDGSSSSATNTKLNSITLSGHSLAEFGASSLVDLNKQIANGTNTHFIIGQTHDSLGDHGYLWIH
jgi:Ca2+-binding RTX toxin-like protein